MKNPCHGCTERTHTCHADGCNREKAYKTYLAIINKKKADEAIINGYLKTKSEKMRRGKTYSWQKSMNM